MVWQQLAFLFSTRSGAWTHERGGMAFFLRCWILSSPDARTLSSRRDWRSTRSNGVPDCFIHSKIRTLLKSWLYDDGEPAFDLGTVQRSSPDLVACHRRQWGRRWMYTGIVVARSKKEIEIGILSFVAENVPNRGNLCHHKIVVTFFLLSSMYRSAQPMPAYIKRKYISNDHPWIQTFYTIVFTFHSEALPIDQRERKELCPSCWCWGGNCLYSM